MSKTSPTVSEEPPFISVVVPLYCCEAFVVELHERLVRTLSSISPRFEIVLVNDASPQADWQRVRELAASDPRVKAINLSRNFGQHYAITAGVDHAEGDWVVVMDGDLQDPPEEIARMYGKAREGYDIVFGVKPKRSHGFLKRLTSRGFTRMLAYLMDTDLDNSVTHFSIVSRKVADNLRQFKERNRSYAFFLRWMGFHVGYIEVEHHARPSGESSYTLRKLLRLAFELTVSQSDKPLRVSILFGFVTASLALAAGVVAIVRYFFWATPVEGWTSVIVSLYFIGGILLMAMGVLGLYVGKIFEETKGRPLYVVKDTINFPLR
jgi:polyisoprenyl-phosphate glycosyltransferase